MPSSECPIEVDGDGKYSTPQSQTPTQAGTYYCVFFFNDTATTEIYTLSLHDALPIFAPAQPAIATTQDPASGTVGDTFKDKAKLSGLFGAHAGGSVKIGSSHD